MVWSQKASSCRKGRDGSACKCFVLDEQNPRKRAIRALCEDHRQLFVDVGASKLRHAYPRFPASFSLIQLATTLSRIPGYQGSRNSHVLPAQFSPSRSSDIPTFSFDLLHL